MTQTHVPLAGSRRPAKSDAVRVGDVAADAPVEVTVTLRGPDLPEPDGEPIDREQLAARFGASAEDVETVTKALEGYGLRVEEASPETRSLRVAGTAAQIQDAFRPGLGVYRSAAQGEFRGRQGAVQIPRELDGIVTGVFGLDQRRVAHRTSTSVVTEEAAAAVATGLGPAELEQHYHFPAGDATGQTIAIAEFGGGYFPDDLEAFCQRHHRAVPRVTTVAVGLEPLTLDDIRRLPKRARIAALNETVEVMMDVEIVAGLCPGSEIVVYFATFDQKGWVDMLDRVIAGHVTPAALSISWGLAEDAPDWSAAALRAINQRLRAVALLGITVCVASGDDGSGDQMQDGRAHVNFPASSPSVLAVGGTMIAGGHEVVWWEAPGERTSQGGGATGGGVSDEFQRPAWQTVDVDSLNPGSIEGRVVPDVAALAGPPLYDMLLLGRPMPGGGTSASAPLWAALIARVAQAAPAGRRAAFLAPLLYQDAANGRPRGASVCSDITHGNNTSPNPGVGYRATVGFDAVTGWGVPNGEALLASL
jgi:kumamolisin